MALSATIRNSLSRNCEATRHPSVSDDFLLRLCTAIVFTGLCMSFLTFAGVVRSNNTCPDTSGGYTKCCFIQDLRSLVSCCTGACMCWHLHMNRAEQCPPTTDISATHTGSIGHAIEKVQLYVFML
eukprot:TRINITY_DN79116_c0_g1_i1.p1 TRINITY_DN79116_c0_g1~~TRINITY_DN79116_c0_g1_i1.p1  ORF type:complete len:126 (+),score=13.26 TRINITY_DN79116_c0_g1_i1:187-564(+)